MTTQRTTLRAADVATKRELTFVVPGVPSPKKRPRVVRLPNGQIRTYTPDEASFIPRVQTHAQNAGVTVYDGGVALGITISRRAPMGWSQKKRLTLLGTTCTSGADAVNVAAAICDALEGAAYHDDRVVQLDSCWRFWAEQDETRITVQRL